MDAVARLKSRGEVFVIWGIAQAYADSIIIEQKIEAVSFLTKVLMEGNEWQQVNSLDLLIKLSKGGGVEAQEAIKQLGKGGGIIATLAVGRLYAISNSRAQQREAVSLLTEAALKGKRWQQWSAIEQLDGLSSKGVLQTEMALEQIATEGNIPAAWGIAKIYANSNSDVIRRKAVPLLIRTIMAEEALELRLHQTDAAKLLGELIRKEVPGALEAMEGIQVTGDICIMLSVSILYIESNLRAKHIQAVPLLIQVAAKGGVDYKRIVASMLRKLIGKGIIRAQEALDGISASHAGAGDGSFA